MSGIPGLIVFLSQQGCWFGGQAGTITFEWTMLDPPARPAAISWELNLGELTLAAECQILSNSQLALTLPAVRTLTDFRFVYRLHDETTGRELGKDEAVIHCYPTTLLAGMNELLRNRRVVVLDGPGRLSELLRHNGIEHRRILSESQLQLGRVDLLIVGPGELSNRAFSQQSLLGIVKAGAGALILRQDTQQVAGHELVPLVAPPPAATWRADNPLAANLPLDTFSSLISNARHLRTLSVPDASRAICYWPGVATDDFPAHVRALLATYSLGRGRLVLCQLPVDDWESDPRSLIMLRNALIYLRDRNNPVTTRQSSLRDWSGPTLITTADSNLLVIGASP